MTYKQMKWAEQHDWFLKAEYLDGVAGYLVVVRGEVELGEAERLSFDSFKRLRQWAGY